MAGTLILKAGDTIDRTITVTDSSGNAIDISTFTLFFKIAINKSDKNDDAIYYNDNLSKSDPTHGKATLNISSDESSLWNEIVAFWQLWYTDSATKKHTDIGLCVIQKTLSTNG